MERIWTFTASAVCVFGIDFLDPAVAHEPDARERGVRVEVRPFRQDLNGSLYASPQLSLEPALVRVDLLESAPHEADRMHWHPQMSGGEPGERVFDQVLSNDPGGWLASFLADLDTILRAAHPAAVVDSVATDFAAVAAERDEIVQVALSTLAEARKPWHSVTHDARGLGAF
jgi:hypothetical protein